MLGTDPASALRSHGFPHRETFELRADSALAVDLSAEPSVFNINVSAANR